MGKKCPRLLNGDGDEKALAQWRADLLLSMGTTNNKTEQFKL
jgi:hypothetical protein